MNIRSINDNERRKLPLHCQRLKLPFLDWI